MAERGITVTYETVRAWCERFGRDYAKRVRARRGQVGDTWHLDAVFVRIGGRLHYLWRAVDQDGSVLDILVQSRRSKKAAARFFRKLPRGLKCAPRVVVTDKLASYGTPCAELLPDTVHRWDKGLNNRAENSHLPTRQRERRMGGQVDSTCSALPLDIQHDFRSVQCWTPPAVSVQLSCGIGAGLRRMARSHRGSCDRMIRNQA